MERTETADVKVGAGGEARRKLVGLDCADDVSGLVGERLGHMRHEVDAFVMELLRILVEAGEERVLELHVSHVDLQLRVVDGLRQLDATLHHVGPGPGFQRLVFEECRPGDANVRTADDHAVDVPLDPPTCCLEAELAAVTATGAEIEARIAHPGDGQVFKSVARGEDAQRLA